MNILKEITDNIKEVTDNKILKLSSVEPGIYSFRILVHEPSDVLHILEFWRDSDKVSDKGEPLKEVMHFLPEDRAFARTFEDEKNKVRDVLYFHIYLSSTATNMVLVVSQMKIIKELCEQIEQIPTKKLPEVSFTIKKIGKGMGTKYEISTVLIDGNIAYTPLPEKALELMAKNPPNLKALIFNESPWENIKEYDISKLKIAPAKKPKIASSTKKTVEATC